MTEQTPTSFRAVVESQMRDVYRLAFELTRNHQDAEDLSQEVFLKAWRSLDDFKEQSKIATWLYRITVNTYLNARRKKTLRFRELREDMAAIFSGSIGDGTSRDVESTAIRKHVDRAVKQLSPRERTAFVLRCEHGLSIRETAASMDIAEGTVKSLQFRAVQKLQDRLAFLDPNT